MEDILVRKMYDGTNDMSCSIMISKHLQKSEIIRHATLIVHLPMRFCNFRPTFGNQIKLFKSAIYYFRILFLQWMRTVKQYNLLSLHKTLSIERSLHM